ncbi:hypothetical protein ACJX0J_027228, partial [Zea mays]
LTNNIKTLITLSIEIFGKQSKEISLEWWRKEKKYHLKKGIGNGLTSSFCENPTEDKSFPLWHGNKSNHYWLNDCCFNNISPPNAANIMLESGLIQNMYGWLASISLA